MNVELITAAEVTMGDTLVSFTPVGQDITIPPTQRQLNRARTFIVPSISYPRAGLVEFGTGPDRWTGLLTAHVWRTKDGS